MGDAGIPVREFDTVPLVSITKVKGAEGAQMVLIPGPKSEAKRELSTDQQELVDIIAALGARNQDFAVQIGIGLSRLSSYIYGRTASVPEEVMARAREIFEDQKSGLAEVKSRFDKPMSEILKDWQRRLQSSTQEELAKLLGVTTMTIHRWNANDSKPDKTSLMRYETQVQKLEVAMAAALKHITS